jgi:hypothetical protein
MVANANRSATPPQSSPRPPMLTDAVWALGFALITISAADFLFWLTS